MSLYKQDKTKIFDEFGSEAKLKFAKSRPQWLNLSLLTLAAYMLVCIILHSIDLYEAQKELNMEFAKTEAMKLKDISMYNYMKKEDDKMRFEVYSSFASGLLFGVAALVASCAYLFRSIPVLGLMGGMFWLVQFLIIISIFEFGVDIGYAVNFLIVKIYHSGVHGLDLLMYLAAPLLGMTMFSISQLGRLAKMKTDI